MPGTVSGKGADRTVAQQVKVADGIEDLMFDEFVIIAQAVFIENAIFIDDDGVCLLYTSDAADE